MTVHDDLARLELVIDRAPGRSVQHRERDMEAYKRVEAEIARLQAEAKHGERAWEQMRERAEKAEAEVARLEAEMVPRAFSIAQQEEIMRLRDGLRGIDRLAEMLQDRHTGFTHIRRKVALLADQDGAA